MLITWGTFLILPVFNNNSVWLGKLRQEVQLAYFKETYLFPHLTVSLSIFPTSQSSNTHDFYELSSGHYGILFFFFFTIVLTVIVLLSQ